MITLEQVKAQASFLNSISTGTPSPLNTYPEGMSREEQMILCRERALKMQSERAALRLKDQQSENQTE